MTTYIVKSRKTEQYYICQVYGDYPEEGEMQCVNIVDRYRYYIPIEDLVVVLMADEDGIR